MRPRRNIRFTIAVGVVVMSASVAGCSDWRGANSLPLPGTQRGGTDGFDIQVQLPEVDHIERNSRVRVGDVTIGNVEKIELQGWHALLTLRLNGDVDLPENSTVSVGQTSLLGSLHVELAPANGVPAVGRLHEGSLIPLAVGKFYPSTEQTLSAVSLVLNNGGIGHIQEITESLSTAFAGRADDLRSLIQQLDQFIAHLNDQTGDIISATDSLNALVAQFAQQKPVVDKALKTLPDALAVLSDQRQNLTDAMAELGKFSALAADSTNQTKDNLVQELKDIGPVLQSLADAGPALTRSLSFFATFPWPKDQLYKWVRGDYANLNAVIDLTMSRIDQSLFTGTRFEGDLTKLELQWGRTIGQMPSPATAANPLLAPYRWDQGP